MYESERKRKFPFRFSQFFPFSVRQRVLSVVLREMSAVRKLCSLIHKSSRSIVTLKKRDFYTTNYKTLSSRDNVVVMTNLPSRQIVKLQVNHYSQALGSLTKDQAHDLVFRLNEEERTVLYNTLEQFQMKEDKQKMECESHFILARSHTFISHILDEEHPPFFTSVDSIQSNPSVSYPFLCACMISNFHLTVEFFINLFD